MTESTHVLQRSLPVAIALVASFVLAPAATRAGAGPVPGPSAAQQARLAHTSSLIESAFLRGEADLLAPALSRRVKIFLAVPPLEVPDGYYGADQVIVLFRRAFAGRSTLRFAAHAPEPRARAGGQVLLTARWSARDASSVEMEHRLTFVLAPEDDALTVREIRELK
jgi:hypothetical protein